MTDRRAPIAARRPLPAGAQRTITILGATGSVGMSTLAVIGARPGDFRVEAVTAHGNAKELARIARSVGARLAAVADPAAYGELKEMLAGTGIEAAAGPDAIEAAAARPVDLVLAAIVGAAGLAPTLAAIGAGSRVALANKECLVCAGELFMEAARKAGIDILPVDSEHNAIFQVIGGKSLADVERITLTGSGGPFREWSRAAMASAPPEAALKHPNWSMGPKITIDSATLMNKGLELIEAHHLFGAPNALLEVLVHPQSIVHGIVTFRDGAMIAQMGPADMRLPISHCLAWPERETLMCNRVDLAALGRLEFARPDLERFPALALARRALEAGGWATNILNAANEIAVAAYLASRIGFLDIATMVEETIAEAAAAGLDRRPATVTDALALDGEGRRMAAARISKVERRDPPR